MRSPPFGASRSSAARPSFAARLEQFERMRNCIDRMEEEIEGRIHAQEKALAARVAELAAAGLVEA